MRIPRPLLAAALSAVLAASAAFLASARAEDPPPAAAESEPGPNILMHIDGTAIDACLSVPGFGMNEIMLNKLKSERGAGNVLVAGSGTNGVLVQVVVTKEDGGHLTDAEWRKKVMKNDDEMQTFDADDAACFDDSVEKGDGLKNAIYHAFITAGGWCFDIQMSQMGDLDDDGLLNKRKFRGFLSSFRVGSFRRGSFVDYPKEVVQLWHTALRKHPDTKKTIDDAAAAKPSDWVPTFVAWEYLRGAGAPEAEVTAANEKAAKALAESNSTDPKVCFAWAATVEALGAPLHASGKYKLAVPLFQKALEVCPEAAWEFRARIAYDLARAWTKAGSAKDAIPALKIALEVDPRLKNNAPKEPDFALLKARPDFKELTKQQPK